MTRFHFILSILGCLFVACGGSGLGSEVRQDMQAQLESARPMISECYAQALQRNRKLGGNLTLGITTQPKTGQFSKVTVLQSDLNDQSLHACIVQQVSQLKLGKPTKTAVETQLPLQLTPVDG